MGTPGTLGSGGAGVAPPGGSRAAVPRRRRGWKDSLPELPLVLFSASRTSAAATCPPRPVLRLHHYSSPLNKLRRRELCWQSTREMPMPFGHVPLEHPSTGGWEGSTRRLCGGVGHPPPPGCPGTPSQCPERPWSRSRATPTPGPSRLPEAPATAGAGRELSGPG